MMARRRPALVGPAPFSYNSVMPITYRTLPVPAFEEFTARIAAGAVTFGVEYRHLDEAVILAYYGPDARAKFDNKAPAGFDGPVEEDGLSLHVFGTRDGVEYLRFDCFDDAAHYHLLDPRGPANTVIEHDAEIEGPLLDWALRALRTRLPELLERAGARDLAQAVEPAVVAAALQRVAAESARMQAAGAPVRVAPTPAAATTSPR
jgi:hypothetical protein